MIQQLHIKNIEQANKLNKLYNNLKNKTGKYNTILVKYYLEGCPACIHFEPIWKQTFSLAKQEKNLSNILFVEVNSKILDYLTIPQVYQFPTIKLFNNKYIEGVDFNKNRTPSNLVYFIKQYTRPRSRRYSRRRSSSRSR